MAALIATLFGALAAAVVNLQGVLDRGSGEEAAFFFIGVFIYLGELAPFGLLFIGTMTIALAARPEPILRVYFAAVATFLLLLMAEAAEFSDLLAEYFSVADLRWIGAGSAVLCLVLLTLLERIRRAQWPD